MSKSRALKALAITVFVSGVWDAIGALIYLALFGRGTGDSPTHPFHALFVASFLVCFAYLLILSAFNIRRYLLILGAVIIGRIWYAAQFLAFMLVVPDFPRDYVSMNCRPRLEDAQRGVVITPAWDQVPADAARRARNLRHSSTVYNLENRVQ
jgi:hypothetical protein